MRIKRDGTGYLIKKICIFTCLQVQRERGVTEEADQSFRIIEESLQ